jgi:lipopolysaccharide biosynthesis protein
LFSTTNWLQNNKVAVCLYLYHIDLWPEFKSLLLPLSKYIKLYIGLCEENSQLNDFKDFDHHISIHKNYGADIAPFLQQLRLIQEPVFIKIHSKKSLWGHKFHINWRHMLLDDMIGSLSGFKKNIKQLLSNDDIGTLCTKVLLMENREFYNSNKIKELCSIINMNYEIVKNSQFVAGNMFMGRTEIFKNTFSEHIDSIDALLYNERGKVDDSINGTYSHSMERIFGYCIKYKNKLFTSPNKRYIKILNSKATNGKYFHLNIMNNSHCYIMEDPNVYGILQNDDQKINIQWKHMEQDCAQQYIKINKNTIKQSNDN